MTIQDFQTLETLVAKHGVKNVVKHLETLCWTKAASEPVKMGRKHRVMTPAASAWSAAACQLANAHVAMPVLP